MQWNISSFLGIGQGQLISLILNGKRFSQYLHSTVVSLHVLELPHSNAH